jgi:hypothetical protein
MRSSWTRNGRISFGAALAALLALATFASASWAPPGAPSGVTPFAGDHEVSLAWASSAGASSYTILRGTSENNVTTPVGSTASTSFTDSTANNNVTYFYKVVAVSGAGNSPASQTVSATPRAASCSTGNAIAVENCLPGSTGWKTPNATSAFNGGIEGFTTDSSIAAGGSVGLKVNTAANAPYRIDIYRTGWYGGDQGRLVGRLNGLSGQAQPDCSQNYTTGERSCANWTTSTTLQTSADWPSGVYILKFIREDNNATNYGLLTVRDDSRVAPAAFIVPTDTYQAYNDYGGRSLYDFNSCCSDTVAGSPRAVKVSFDRPYRQSISGQHDWYTVSDVQIVSWLERQGYDVSYLDSGDANAGVGSLNARSAIMLGAHDEYQSGPMRSNLTAARDAGVDLFNFGANAGFWRARYEASSVTGLDERTLVSYKTTEGGIADPVSPTTTWRDPLGANQPENSLYGGMYVGQSQASFPLFITAEQGKHRFWRYTVLDSLAPGTKAQVNYSVVGWEWDRRVNNGMGPANVEALSSSPVSGEILQDAGKVYSPGSETQETTIYTAASGARVWSAGTNQWSLGLGYNMYNVGEPDSIMQQGTANALADAGVRPTTPSGITVDTAGNLVLTGATPPLNGSGQISTTGTGVLTFDRLLDPSTVTASAITLTGPGNASVPLDLDYDKSTKSVSITPEVPLDGNTQYTIRIGTGLTGWNGLGLSAPGQYTFTTGQGAAPVVTDRTPNPGATSTPLGTTVTATFDRGLKASTVTTANVRLTGPSGQVAATVAYDSATRKATLTPSAPLTPSTTYTATLTTGIQAVDGTPLATALSWSFTTADVITITGRTPAPLATGISTRTQVRVTFSRSVDAATLTPASFNLTGVTAAISYDAATRTATLTPALPLNPGSTYTVNVGAQIKGVDNSPLAGASSWTFSTALVNPPAPAATSTTPAGSATQVSPDTVVRAIFDRALDPATVTPSAVTLTGPSGIVAATISYEAATQNVVITPSARLLSNTVYEARVASAVRSTLGQPLAADLVWSFTTSDCPCSTMATLAPSFTGVAVQDGRFGPGPWSRELGVKIAVDEPSKLTAIRFYKSPGETGTHVGRLWTSGGASLATTTFTNETPSGWQQQNLATPITLKPGRVYVISYNVNDYYVVTRDQLATSLHGGPLFTVADGANGVFADEAGQFPVDSWRTSNYFADGVVTSGAAAPATPELTTRSPLHGADGLSTSTNVTAGFSVAMDASTITGSTFDLRPLGGGAAVPATVTYNESTRIATLDPTGPLAAATTYEARLTTGIHAYDDTPLAGEITWRFTTVDASIPQVTGTSPSAGATAVTTSTDVRATFSIAMDQTTVNASNVTLAGPSGTVPATVSYTAATRTAILTPSAPLAASTTYTATVSAAVKASTGAALPSPLSWSFTTSACPCRLFDNSQSPERTRPVQDGRAGSGPWSYEMGMKIAVSQPAQLTALRFYKSAGEGGTHIGRVWAADGSPIAQVTYTNETSTGWQQQSLATPIQLTPGQVYVVSVGINDVYSVNTSGLASALTSGPLSSVDDGANGVYGQAAGLFPTEHWSESNYWIDAVVR